MRAFALAAALACVCVGCLYDDDARCDPGQVITEDGYCICREGSVLEGNRCAACRQGQVVVNGRCVCAQGLVPQGNACVSDEGDSADMPSADSAPSGQGMSCTAGGNECAGLEASYCESMLLGQCLVQGCSPGGADCSVGWTCCDIALAKTTLCLEQARLLQELGSASCPSL